MDDKLSREEVAVLIRSRQIAKKIGLGPEADVKTICEQAGISRKTGYQWTEKFSGCSSSNEDQLERRLKQLEAEHEALKQELDDVRFENEGRKLAWEIHKVDELLAAKKNTTISRKRKKR
jgi:transposase